MDAEQLANVQTIAAVRRRLGAPPKALVIAVATAMQESSLHKVPYGDRDSLGLFQQRDPWGSRAERLDQRPPRRCSSTVVGAVSRACCRSPGI